MSSMADGVIGFPSTLYSILHAASWDAGGELRALADRFGSPALEPLTLHDVRQTWRINRDGYVQNYSSGEFLTSKAGCVALEMTKDVPNRGWTILRHSGSELAYRMESDCGSVFASEGGRGVSMEVDGSDWFIIPVGTVGA